jgi:hypothetical protein
MSSTGWRKGPRIMPVIASELQIELTGSKMLGSADFYL